MDTTHLRSSPFFALVVAFTVVWFDAESDDALFCRSCRLTCVTVNSRADDTTTMSANEMDRRSLMR